MKKIHVGKNIRRIRVFRSMSQQDMAVALEEIRRKPVSQQQISDIEQKEEIDEELLRQISEVLNTTPELLETLDLENSFNVIGSTFNNQDQSSAINQPINSTFHINPLDKLVSLFQEEKAELKAE